MTHQNNKKTFLTEFQAIDITDNELKLFAGINIEAYTYFEAEEYCKTYYPYLKVIGIWEETIELKVEGNINLN